MVVSNSNMIDYSLIFMNTFYFFLLLIPYATPLEFNLPHIGPQNQDRDIRIEGSGYISNRGIQITPDSGDMSQNAGRATYIQPLHLWDRSSRKLADFNTSFTFVIDSNGTTPYADGLAFFLASNNAEYTKGGAMGLPIDPVTINATANFVAVEFDTFWNDWDPKTSTNSPIGDHVGIDINSLTSVRSQKWWSNITGGGENEAWISYDSTSKSLRVIFTGFINGTRVEQYGLHYTVDLRKVLPEWVMFGFSASTGAFFETNNVKSWNFCSSNLPGSP